VADGQLHLLFTAYDSAIDLARRVLGRATCNVNDLIQLIETRASSGATAASIHPAASLFSIDPAPLLAVEGGGEAPRLFRHDGAYHLFYRHFDRSAGSRWRHYLSADLRRFTLHDPHLFDGLGDPENDVNLVTTIDGAMPRRPEVLVSAIENGTYRLFEYPLVGKV
jgi:hypothetical protein